jgi:hypothetical protein
MGIFKVSNLEKAKGVLGGSANSTPRRGERRPIRDRRSYSAPGTSV